MIKACIFDLDGVVVDTAKYHYIAWKKLANSLGFDFTEADNEKLKGVSRMGSLDLILEWGGKTFDEEKKKALAEQKNHWYIEFIEKMKPDEILEGVEEFLEDLKQRKMKTGLGSASKNARRIVEKVGLVDNFEVIIDGTLTEKSKPHPEVFLKAAAAMGVRPDECIVFEDAEKGIEAALSGGFFAVGVGEPEVLHLAHVIIPGFKDFNFDQLLLTLQETV